MDENKKKRELLEAEVNLANDLVSLDGNNGWERVKGWMLESIKLAKDNLADEKKTRSMVDVARYQQTVRLYEKLLDKIEIDKQRGIKAKEKLDA